MTIKDGLKADVGDKTSQKPDGTSGKTFTEEQVKEAERKARSDALAEAGRFKAESEKALKAAQAAQERISRMEQERLDAELESHKDDPAEIRRIRAEQKARQLETELADERQAKADYESKLKSYQDREFEATKLTLSQEVAKKFNVDAERLSSLSKLTDGSEKAIEAIAEIMPKVSKSFNPDSNRGMGGMLSWEQIQADFIKDPYNPAYKQRYLEAKAQR